MKHTNKVRAMKGVKPGRGSAGRANQTGRGHHAERKSEGPRPDAFRDVSVACKLWLVSHGHWQGFGG